ncbi:LapA family protein [Rhodobacteraceae bacterium NNCM2]|nr:LapA family protein [Coraliihabitans acroporae]
MRFLKTLVLILIGICLVVLGIGNMALVDLHLVPQKIAGSDLSIKQIPLAAVIMVSVLIGLVIGQLMEWLREGKHRRVSNDRGREVAKLRTELDKVREKVEDPDDDLPRIPVR